MAQPDALPIRDLVDDVTDLASVSMWRTTITIPDRKLTYSYRLSVREREDRLVENTAPVAAAPVAWGQLGTDVKGRYIDLDEIPL